MQFKEEFLINGHQFRIEVDGLREYIQGKESLLFRLFIDNVDVTLDYTEMPYLNKSLGKWKVVSQNSEFIFLPIDSGSILINTKTLKKHQLPVFFFMANHFESNVHFVMNGQGILVTSLKTMNSVSVFADDVFSITEINILSENIAELECVDSLGIAKSYLLNIEEQTLQNK